MMLRQTIFAAALVATFAVFAVGCSGGDKSENAAPAATTGGATADKGGAPAADPNKPLKLAFVTNNSSDYWTIAHRGVDKAVGELKGVTVDFQMPQNGTAAEQKAIVDALLVKGVDGIAISPKDPKTQTSLINDWASKTLLITQDSDAADSKRACYIGTDNVAAGRKVGEELKKALPNGGKIIAFVGDADAQNAHDRLDGIKDAIKGTKIDLVDVRTDNADHQKAKANVQDVLVAKPDVVGLVGIWSYNGPAIVSAVKAANKVGQIKIVCFDEEDGTLAGVKDGSIAATVVQHPFEFGYQAIIKMAKYLRGDKTAFPDNKLNIVDTQVLHAGDVDKFKADLDKLRGK
jgi:ribose transport system substrate-binding protein